jgi:hypothetical protein
MGLGMRRVNGCRGAAVLCAAIYSLSLELRKWGWKGIARTDSDES